MSRLTDPDTLLHYSTALSLYRFDGYVVFSPDAANWLRKELQGWTQQRFAQDLDRYVRDGGKIDQVVESRPEWSGKYAYHYDLRLFVKSRSQKLYVETRLVPDYPNKRDNPYVLIANIHDA